MPVVGMVFGFIVLVLALLGAVAVTIVRIIKGKAGGMSPEEQADEARELQEMHQMLLRMEQRIEALETILMETEGKDGEQK